MKKLLLLPLAFFLSYCNCTKSAVSKAKEYSIMSPCPENGVCKIQILKNKSLNVKTDDLGILYYQLSDNENTSVIQYTYDRKVEKGLEDAQHREEIIFEIKNITTELNLQDNSLQETKMLFGRLCFCRGQTGYYKVENGTLKLQNTNEIITLDLNFKINEVPQLYDSVKATIK